MLAGAEVFNAVSLQLGGLVLLSVYVGTRDQLGLAAVDRNLEVAVIGAGGGNQPHPGAGEGEGGRVTHSLGAGERA